jgi:hypothetical protein
MIKSRGHACSLKCMTMIRALQVMLSRLSNSTTRVNTWQQVIEEEGELHVMKTAERKKCDMHSPILAASGTMQSRSKGGITTRSLGARNACRRLETNADIFQTGFAFIPRNRHRTLRNPCKLQALRSLAGCDPRSGETPHSNAIHGFVSNIGFIHAKIPSYQSPQMPRQIPCEGIPEITDYAVLAGEETLRQNRPPPLLRAAQAVLSTIFGTNSKAMKRNSIT